MTGIKVGTEYLNLTTDPYGKTKKTKTVIDSGTTLAYLPDAIYKPLVKEVIFVFLLMHLVCIKVKILVF